ncbi:hypothetical protein [Caulobacter segnis]
MTDASDFLPTSFNPVEEELFGKAYCKTCHLKHFVDARVWAHQHVRETGHAVELLFGYDVRDEHWMSRLSYERLAELEALRADPAAAKALAAKLLKGGNGV